MKVAFADSNTSNNPPQLVRQESIPVVALKETFSCLRIACVATLLPLCLTLFLKVNNSWSAYFIAILIIVGVVMTLTGNPPKLLGSDTAATRRKKRAETAFNQQGKKYVAFISHSKRDTGTEASLIYDAMQFRWPSKEVFLDSKELRNLADLLPSVSDSRFFIVLLSPTYINRPSCMAELMEALSCKLDIVTINVQRQGVNVFDFEGVGKMIGNKKTIQALYDTVGWQQLKDLGFDMQDVIEALKTLITIKAFSYHPHEAPNVRAAELENMFIAFKELDHKND